MSHPLLAGFAWHALPPALQPLAVMFAAREVNLIAADPRVDLRRLLDERHAALSDARPQPRRVNSACLSRRGR